MNYKMMKATKLADTNGMIKAITELNKEVKDSLKDDNTAEAVEFVDEIVKRAEKMRENLAKLHKARTGEPDDE